MPVRRICGRNAVISIVFLYYMSEQALYRLLRLFSKVRARSCRCSSFPNRTHSVGLRFGIGCEHGSLGIYSVAMFQLVASDISLATSFFISLQSSSRAHSAAPRFQITTAALGCDLVLGVDLGAAGIYTVSIFQRNIIRTCFRLAMGSDYCFSLTVTKLHTFATACGADPLPNRGDRGKRNDHKCQQGRYHTRYRPFSVFAALLPSCLAFCSCCQRANSRWLSSLS